MKKIACLFVFLFLGTANATLIDTTATWSGNINTGWFGSGQSFLVDAEDTFFDDIIFSFDSASNGRTFNFILSDLLNGGTTLFSTSFVVNNGFGFIDIDTNLFPNSTVYAMIDYNGYSGASAYYQGNIYAGGNSNFGANGSKQEFSDLDHVFVANFRQAAQVPAPATLALFALGLAGIGFSRKMKQA